jgi:hypothetical protein
MSNKAIGGDSEDPKEVEGAVASKRRDPHGERASVPARWVTKIRRLISASPSSPCHRRRSKVRPAPATWATTNSQDLTLVRPPGLIAGRCHSP